MVKLWSSKSLIQVRFLFSLMLVLFTYFYKILFFIFFYFFYYCNSEDFFKKFLYKEYEKYSSLGDNKHFDFFKNFKSLNSKKVEYRKSLFLKIFNKVNIFNRYFKDDKKNVKHIVNFLFKKNNSKKFFELNDTLANYFKIFDFSKFIIIYAFFSKQTIDNFISLKKKKKFYDLLIMLIIWT